MTDACGVATIAIRLLLTRRPKTKIARRKFGAFVWSLHSYSQITSAIKRASLSRDRPTIKGWHVAQEARILFLPRDTIDSMGYPLCYAPKAVLAWARKRLIEKWGR